MPNKKTTRNIKFFDPLLSKKYNDHIDINVIFFKDFKKWLKTQENSVITQATEQGFEGKAGQILIVRNNKGAICNITTGSSNAATFEDGAKIYNSIASNFSKNTLKSTSFAISSDINVQELERLSIGWALAAYKFDFYKKNENPIAKLFLSPKINRPKVKAYIESICFIRDLVNMPANDMSPADLEKAAKFLAKKHNTKTSIIKDKELISQNFPMIYEVGKASSCPPRLIDFSWGDETNPKVTLVGKGVCFDTGGLDIKPSQFMLTMKKDMGGAAHVLGLAHMIMSLKMPIYLRVLIPAVENSISSNAYRPSDIINSRKGLSVEVGNTDAEGRLVLADALSFACEDKPDLLIDFATLTGAARIALGYDLPALFSNNDKIAQKIQKRSAETSVNDPVWQLPLWQPYRKDLDSAIADISSTGTGRAGATNAALFLQEFVEKNIDWIHMDVYAWEQNGKAGRPKGGADTGMRAIFAYLEKQYHND